MTDNDKPSLLCGCLPFGRKANGNDRSGEVRDITPNNINYSRNTWGGASPDAGEHWVSSMIAKSRRQKTDFCNNTVTNSKYNIFTFIPLNLWEQFHRPINLYFLIVAALQFISIIAPVSPLSTLLPLLAAFALTAIKEGYDDWHRHQADHKDNERLYSVLFADNYHSTNILHSLSTASNKSKSNKGESDQSLARKFESFSLRERLKDTRSSDIHVGDLILLREGDAVPCDIVALLSLSNEDVGEEDGEEQQPEGVVYVSTENLDGENDAKPKQCALSTNYYVFQSTQGQQPQQQTQDHLDPNVLSIPEHSDYELSQDRLCEMVEYVCGTSKHGDTVRSPQPAVAAATLHCEGPNTFMKQFNGKISFYSENNNNTVRASTSSKQAPIATDATISLDINNLVLASSVVHNTPYLIGMVVYTGHETKVGMTKKFPPLKWARLDQQTSSYSKRVFVFQFLIVLICTVLGSAMNVHAQDRSWYLAYADEKGPMVANASDDLNNWVFFVVILPLRFFLLLTVMVPISFKVMVDLSKYYLARTITWDLGLYYNPADEPDSDIEDGDVRAPEEESLAPADVCAVVNNSTLAEDLGQIQYVMTDKTGTLTRNKMSLRFVEVIGDAGDALHVYQKGEKACSSDKTDWKTAVHRQTFAELGRKLEREGFDNHLRMLEILSLCNTIEKPAPTAGAVASCTSLRFGASHRRGEDAARRIPKVQWASPSPDETALVKGAAWCGATILDRRRKDSFVAFGGKKAGGSVTVYNPHTESSWSFGKDDIVGFELLCLLPFSSDRGRMSILVRNTTTQLVQVLTKGADERVMPLATNSPKAVHELFSKRLVMYSNRGLRTLVFASRVVEEDEVGKWLSMYQLASTADGEAARKKSLTEAFNALEKGLSLVGITAVEDKLQTGVPETIAILREAGIRVWMLTGDKTETAKQIALACKLTLPTDEVLDLTFDALQVPTGLSFVDHMAAKLANASAKMRDGCSAKDFGREMSNTLCCLNSDVNSGTGSDTPLIRNDLYGTDSPPRPWWSRAWLSVVGAFTCSHASRMPIQEVLNPTATLAKVVRGEPHTFATTTPYGGGDYLSTMSPNNDGKAPNSPCDPSRAKCQSIVVNSGAISLLQQNPQLLASFRPVLLAASTVICSRVTPDQKSLIVKIVKDSGKMTLAIGDGGNDVAMIQEAHVGVGITGYEGKQAAKAADFSFGQFRFLSRLLLVHGHMAYQRTAYIVQYSFYKSMIIAFIQVLFNFYTMMSGVSFWNSLALTTYNGVFTVPLTLLYVMDIHALPKEGLLKSPYLYSLSQAGRYLNGSTFFYYVTRGIVQAVIAFYVTKYIFLDAHFITNDGFPMDGFNNSVPVYGAIVFVQVLMVLCESHSVTWLHWVSFFFSFGSYLLVFVVYSQIESMDFYKQFDFTCRYMVFYLGFFLTVVMVFGIYAIFYPFIYNYFPSVLQLHRKYAPTSNEASPDAQDHLLPAASPNSFNGSSLPSPQTQSRADVKCPLIPSTAYPQSVRKASPIPAEDADPIHGSDFASFVRSLRPRL